jgi:RimJ/RimL family protein N-acetyltransferase
MSQLPMLSTVEIATERGLRRKARNADRERLIELQTDPQVWAYLGGPRLREAVEQRLDEIGGAANATPRPSGFVIADKATDELIGTAELKRRAADLPGHITEDGKELELDYLLRHDVWGAGLAFEAAALRAAADELPDQPVILVTQTTNPGAGQPALVQSPNGRRRGCQGPLRSTPPARFPRPSDWRPGPAAAE